jgi:hypothetical protein
MKPSAIFVLLCLAISLLCSAQEKTVPEIPYESVPSLLKLPNDLYLGEAAGVAVNSKGHIFVYTRSSQTRLFEFDAKGNFVHEIGKGLYGFSFAHVVRIDKGDNIWCVDEGSGRRWRTPSTPRDTPTAATCLCDLCPPAVQPAHRRCLGPCRKQFHRRRLWELARGEIRQRWQLGQRVGQAWHSAGRISYRT